MDSEESNADDAEQMEFIFMSADCVASESDPDNEHVEEARPSTEWIWEDEEPENEEGDPIDIKEYKVLPNLLEQEAYQHEEPENEENDLFDDEEPENEERDPIDIEEHKVGLNLLEQEAYQDSFHIYNSDGPIKVEIQQDDSEEEQQNDPTDATEMEDMFSDIDSEEEENSPTDAVEKADVVPDLQTNKPPNPTSGDCTAPENPEEALQMALQRAWKIMEDTSYLYDCEDKDPQCADEQVAGPSSAADSPGGEGSAKGNSICSQCGKACRSPLHLHRHMLTHTQRLFKCIICNKRYLQKEIRDRHVLTHFVEEAEQESCEKAEEKEREHCEEKFKSNSDSQTDIHFECQICWKRFKQRAYLVRHLHLHKGKNFQECPICQQAHGSRRELTKHLHVHCGPSASRQRHFKCPTCPAVLSNKKGLDKHARIHSSRKKVSCNTSGPASASRQQFFRCPMCPAVLSNKKGLNKHAQIHSSRKKVSCNTSGPARAAKKTDCLPHTTLECKCCGMQFTDAVTFRKHILTHSKNIPGEGVPREITPEPFRCNDCKMEFLNQNRLRRHHCAQREKRLKSSRSSVHRQTRTRTDGRSHQCPVCSKVFVKEADLCRHVLLHSSKLVKVPFQSFMEPCNICGKLLTKNNMRRHVQRQHNAEHSSTQ